MSLRHGGPKRVLTTTGTRLRAFPRRALGVLGAAMLLGIPTTPDGDGLDARQVLFLAAALAGTIALTVIAAWCEHRIYRGLVSAHPAQRVLLTALSSLALVVVLPFLLVAVGVVGFVDHGVLAVATFMAAMWFLNASLGTMVVVLIDVVISALIPGFRARVQTAVMALLAVSVGVAVGAFALGGRLAPLLIEAVRRGDIELTGDVWLVRLLGAVVAHPEGPAILSFSFLAMTLVLSLPAILSACGKLADAVMERLNPLAEAMSNVSAGDLDVRVEVGGSRDLAQISDGFNHMADSLAATLGEAEARRRELARAHAAATRFVPFQFLGLLRKASLVEVQRGDQLQLEMTVMFSDIRGFTSLAERMGPAETFAFLNRYMAQMEAEIHREQGFINDFFGDGIMALFPGERPPGGASLPNDASRRRPALGFSGAGADAALRAALGMLRAVEDLNLALRDEGKEPISIGLGLHSGQLMLGTIGGRDRLNCTVVGDPANTAARVEGMTKLYGASLLVSGETLHRLADASRYLHREVDRVQAKGKAEAASIHEVLDGEPEARRDQKLRTRATFAEGVAAYRRGDFEAAREAFARCRREAPDDAAAALYLERCAGAPEPGWDGVTRLSSK